MGITQRRKPHDEDRHPTRLVQLNELAEWIDEDIAELVFEIWRAEIDICSSCQGDPGEPVMLGLWGSDSLCKLLAIVAPYDGDDPTKLYSRVQTAGLPTVDSPDQWEYRFMLIDLRSGGRIARLDTEEPGQDAAEYEVVVTVLFPRSDRPRLLKRLRAHNRAYAKRARERVAKSLLAVPSRAV